jgi:hypothetical protein
MSYENLTDDDLEKLAENAIENTDLELLEKIRGIQICRSKGHVDKQLLQEDK